MRVANFTTWKAKYPGHSGRANSRDGRVLPNLYRTEILLPAFEALAARHPRSTIIELANDYGELRRFAYDFGRGLDDFGIKLHAYVLKINNMFDALAAIDSSVNPQFVGVKPRTMKQRDIPSYDTTYGWMTPGAYDACGAGDYPTIQAVFLGTASGVRSAPAGGHPHYHINGDAHNVMSVDINNRILAFTDHIDSTGPGRAQKRIVDDIVANTQQIGWIWVGFVQGQLYRVVHP